MFKFSFLTAVHQNSTCGAAENVGTATKPNGIMHEPALYLGLLYVGSLVLLLVYSILYGLKAKELNWLRATTSAAVIILDWKLGACLYGFTLLKSRVVILFVADTSRVFLIYFGVHYWYFGQCISYTVVASVLLGAAISWYLSVTDLLAARRDALKSTIIRLREGFRRKYQNSSASSSEGCGSSVKRSSSADDGHLGNATVPCTGDGSTCNNIEGINSDKSIDSGRPSLALCSSSCRSVVQEPEVGSSYVDRNLEHNSSLVVCSSSGLRSQGGHSSTSTSANQQILDLNLALAFQEKLSDPRITSMLKRKGRHADRELANLLQDKGIDPNFAVMLKENGLDPMILDLLQRSITTTRLLEHPNGEFLMKSSSETTTTQYAVVYGDGFSSENREASSQWRKVQDRLETNERCSRLEKINLLEIFQEYIRDLESEEEEQRKLWMIKDFAAYLAISLNTSGSTAKDLFTDVMDELEKQIGLTLSWMLDDFKVAIAKYISSPPMSDTNLKVLHKISGLSAKALVVLPCYISLEVGYLWSWRIIYVCGKRELQRFVFEKLLERAREKEEKEAKKRKRLADEFYELLRASKEITASSKWEDCKSLFGDRQVASFAFIDLELVTRLQEPLENDN
ncbi:hypothetical protein T459_28819 [Capsicum annuum]|uniref:Calpain-type cysteine protease DEK1 n=1 Tax=Capsicum annuum TaxID=4072 RepID=A0A2G2YHV3_CAPAN|nr:hypothetical protein T459_28819 [Capsicum annuum]